MNKEQLKQAEFEIAKALYIKNAHIGTDTTVNPIIATQAIDAAQTFVEFFPPTKD